MVAKLNAKTTILNLFMGAELSYRMKIYRLESIFILKILRKYSVNLYKTYILHTMYG